MKNIQFLLLIIFTLFISGCRSKQTPSDYGIATPAFHVCAITRFFLADLNEHLNKDGESLKTFEPGETQIKKYTLRSYNGTWHLHGMIEANVDFDPSAAQNAGIYIRHTTGSFYTIRIPVKEMGTFLQLNNIRAFVMEKKDYIENNGNDESTD